MAEFRQNSEPVAIPKPESSNGSNNKNNTGNDLKNKSQRNKGNKSNKESKLNDLGNVAANSQGNDSSDGSKKAGKAVRGARLGSKLGKALKELGGSIKNAATFHLKVKAVTSFIAAHGASWLVGFLAVASVGVAGVSSAVTNQKHTTDAITMADVGIDDCKAYVQRAFIAGENGADYDTSPLFTSSIEMDDAKNTVGFYWGDKKDAIADGTEIIHHHADGWTLSDGHIGLDTGVNINSARLYVARRIYSVMLTFGLRPEQVFGLLGNWCVESGLDPTAVETIENEPFTIGETKQYFTMYDFATKHLHIGDLESPKSMEADDRIAYWEQYPTILRAGIGLGQWTDTTTTAGNELKAGEWGRNSQLRRYAAMINKDASIDSAEDLTITKVEDYWKKQTYQGDFTEDFEWYDVDAQLAYTLDSSSVGDANAGFMSAWAGKKTWNRISDEIEHKIRGQLKTDGFIDDDKKDTGSFGEPREVGVWRRKGIADNFGNITATGDKALNMSGSLKWPWNEEEDNFKPFYQKGVGKSDAYNVAWNEDLEDDGYYDYHSTFASTYSSEKNLESGESNKFRDLAQKKAYDLLTVLWLEEGIQNGGSAVTYTSKSTMESTQSVATITISQNNDSGKHHITNYNPEDYCVGFACPECYSLAPGVYNYGTSGKEAVDIDGNHQTDYIKTWEYKENPTTHVMELHWSLAHEQRFGDAANDPDVGYDVSAFTVKKSRCGCAEKAFKRCYGKVYRHWLYRYLTEEYVLQFLECWEGTSSTAPEAKLPERKQNALMFYELWWRNMNSSIMTGGDDYYEPNNGQDQKNLRGLFKVELGYGAGIKQAIDTTQDDEDPTYKYNKRYDDPEVIKNCKHYKISKADSLAITACILAAPPEYIAAHPEGLPIYQEVQDFVLKDYVVYKACDHTIATIVRWSGYDDYYPPGSTITQMKYLVASPRWVEIDWNGQQSTLLPGDIFIRKDSLAAGAPNEEVAKAENELNYHHTFMYVGSTLPQEVGYSSDFDGIEIPETTTIVEGSFGDYGPKFVSKDMNGEDASMYHVFRCIHPMSEKAGTSYYSSFVPSGRPSSGDPLGTAYDENVAGD